MELKQAFFILRHGSSEGLPEYLKAIKTIEDNCLPRHGRWVERPNTKGQVYCSECGTLEKTTDNNFKSMHCPHCGAKMDGDDDATN